MVQSSQSSRCQGEGNRHSLEAEKSEEQKPDWLIVQQEAPLPSVSDGAVTPQPGQRWHTQKT
jgi:hypothetical protein